MKVMLVNDDGYGAPGIEAMAEALKNAGHEVLVVAPDGQRSGSGQSVTLDGEVCAVRKPLGWALTGTPADCVRAGLLHLMPDCDMVISGINLGANLGTDCNYSGTAAAAREAVMNGRAAMAVSCAIRPGEKWCFRDAVYLAEYAVKVMEQLAAHPLPRGVFLNLNLPNLMRGEDFHPGAAPLGWFRCDRDFDVEDRGDEVIFRCRFGTIAHRQEGHSDIALMREGRACMTAVSWDATHAASNAVAEEIAGRMTEK